MTSRLTFAGAAACWLLLATSASAQHGGSPAYRVPPAPGSLPVPWHAPDMDATALAAASQRAYVMNNFGVYQDMGGGRGAYIHDGLDFAMPNGTAVHAVADGVVRIITEGPEYTRSILIEDLGNARLAWSYAHVDGFRVQVGDTVRQGTRIAEVSFFPGVSEHLHLDRLLRPDDVADWTPWLRLVHLNPATHFALPNDQVPAVDPSFRFFRAGSDEQLGAGDDGVTMVAGDVDIVVGVRDRGSYARRAGQDTSVLYFGDRGTVARLQYELRSADGTPVLPLRTAVDFNKLELMSPATAAGREAAAVLLKPLSAVRPGEEWRDVKFSYYVVSRAPPGGPSRRLLPELTSNVWQTGTIPDGDYVLVVRAIDSMGNVAEQQGRVRVRNENSALRGN